jgi:hypothetical protein
LRVMNPAAVLASNPLWILPPLAGRSWQWNRVKLPEEVGGSCDKSDCLHVVTLGVAAFDGYFSYALKKLIRVGYQSWRFHAQAASGDLQSRASFAPYRQRSDRGASQLSVMFGDDREIASTRATTTAFTRDASLHVVRSGGAVHRRRRLTRSRHRAVNDSSTARNGV